MENAIVAEKVFKINESKKVLYRILCENDTEFFLESIPMLIVPLYPGNAVREIPMMNLMRKEKILDGENTVEMKRQMQKLLDEKVVDVSV